MRRDGSETIRGCRAWPVPTRSSITGSAHRFLRSTCWTVVDDTWEGVKRYVESHRQGRGSASPFERAGGRRGGRSSARSNLHPKREGIFVVFADSAGIDSSPLPERIRDVTYLGRHGSGDKAVPSAYRPVTVRGDGLFAPRRYSPVSPSTDSLSRSAWPLCHAYSSIMWTKIHRRPGALPSGRRVGRAAPGRRRPAPPRPWSGPCRGTGPRVSTWAAMVRIYPSGSRVRTSSFDPSDPTRKTWSPRPWRGWSPMSCRTVHHPEST